MRKLLGVVVAAVWLLASIILWAGALRLVPPPSASHAIGLDVSHAVLLAYHLSGVLGTLASAYLSLAIAGLLSGLWLLAEGLIRRTRLAAWLGGAIAIIELALFLFTDLRVRFLLPVGPNAQGLLNASSIAGQLAAEMIPAALLLAVSLGAISLTARRPWGLAPASNAAHSAAPDSANAAKAPTEAQKIAPAAGADPASQPTGEGALGPSSDADPTEAEQDRERGEP